MLSMPHQALNLITTFITLQIQELATCQDSSSRRTQADDEVIRTLKQQMKQVHVEFKERRSELDHQLKGKEEVLKEFHKFIKVNISLFNLVFMHQKN